MPGLEFAGRVVARGPGAALWPDGAEVMAIAGGGAMARRITLHERTLVPVPAGVPLVEAAAIPEVFFTAWDALIRQARLGAGETALIHAAASGIGTAAIQIARAAGARPLGTGRQPGKLARLVDLGLPAERRDRGRGRAASPRRSPSAPAGAAPRSCSTASARPTSRRTSRRWRPRGRMVMLGALGGATGRPPRSG